MLKEKIQQDVKDALKSGDSRKRMVLGMVMAAIKNKEIEKRSELSEEEIIAVLSSEVKKRKDSVEQFEKGSRPELAEQEKQEINILMGYMPEQMPEEQIRKIVKQTIKDMGKPGSESSESLREKSVKGGQSELLLPGKVLQVLMPKVKGKADGQTVSRIVKEELSK